MLKNKIIVRKIRNIIILFMVLMIMLGAYSNIRRSRAEDVLLITATAIDNYGYLENEEFDLEVKSVKDNLYEIELPEHVNSKKINEIIKITLDDPKVEIDSGNAEEEKALTENTISNEAQGEAKTEEQPKEETTTSQEPVQQEQVKQEPVEQTPVETTPETETQVEQQLQEQPQQEKPTTEKPKQEETAPAPEAQAPETNEVEIVDNKIYLTKEQVDTKMIKIEVIYDISLFEKTEDGTISKKAFAEMTEQEREDFKVQQEPQQEPTPEQQPQEVPEQQETQKEVQMLYHKILTYEDEENGKLVEVRGYLPKDIELQVEEVSQEKLTEIFGETTIDVAYDIKLIQRIVSYLPVNPEDPESELKEVIEIIEIDPKQYEEKCEVIIKDLNIKEESKVYHVKEDNTYEEVTVKENTQEQISFEASTFSIYAVGSDVTIEPDDGVSTTAASDYVSYSATDLATWRDSARVIMTR